MSGENRESIYTPVGYANGGVTCDHSKKMLKSHSDIYKVYGFLEQRETKLSGPVVQMLDTAIPTGNHYPGNKSD